MRMWTSRHSGVVGSNIVLGVVRGDKGQARMGWVFAIKERRTAKGRGEKSRVSLLGRISSEKGRGEKG